MILIDENVEAKLTQALEALRTSPKTTRCIAFSPMGKAPDEAFKTTLVKLAQQYIPATEAHIYICADGDVIILAPNIPIKEGKEFILSVANHINKPADDDWIGFYEVSVHINKLLLLVEQKRIRLNRQQEEKQKIAEQQQQQRKRNAILNAGTGGKSGEISRRRAAREKPELMIIEDDAFSRRLVENVLEKKYALTGTGEATNALDTYARIAPDLLFLDINLPDVSGHELLDKIIALDPEAYVIMLSGNCDKDNITQAMTKGAKGFIAKPFTKDKLLQYIERCPTIKQ